MGKLSYKIVERLTRQLIGRGEKNAKSMAIALLHKQGILDTNGKLTAKGKERNSMSPEDRAKDRAAKYNGGKPSDYKYNEKTNRATKKK